MLVSSCSLVTVDEQMLVLQPQPSRTCRRIAFVTSVSQDPGVCWLWQDVHSQGHCRSSQGPEVPLHSLQQVRFTIAPYLELCLIACGKHTPASQHTCLCVFVLIQAGVDPSSHLVHTLVHTEVLVDFSSPFASRVAGMWWRVRLAASQATVRSRQRTRWHLLTMAGLCRTS